MEHAISNLTDLAGIEGLPRFGGGDAAKSRQMHRSKRAATLADAIHASGLRDGGTVSFHHHLRDGDHVLNIVMRQLADLGFRNLHVAASSIFPVHAELVEHIRSGVVTRISSAYIAGPVARAISAGELPHPALMQTHGGRARAITQGEITIDVAFIGAPTADEFGNLNGSTGRSACGPLGYAMVDAEYARHVIAITDTLGLYPTSPIDIAQDRVDQVVVVPSIGDPSKIVSGTTRITEDPLSLFIAESAAKVIEASGLLVDGFSFQTGAGGTSLAVAAKLAEIMRAKGVTGSFAAGGITGSLVAMLREGLFRTLFDVQCFDLEAVASYRDDPAHMAMSAALYASPAGKGAIVDRLDAMILGAAEVDLNFNVNVTAVGGGRIIGGSGGHSDTAAGARLAIVTTQLTSRDNPKIVTQVECVTTPGATIDVVVTEVGIAVNPARSDLHQRLVDAGLNIIPMATLRDLAIEKSGAKLLPSLSDDDRRVVAIVEYRDGSIIDTVRQFVAR